MAPYYTNAPTNSSIYVKINLLTTILIQMSLTKPQIKYYDVINQNSLIKLPNFFCYWRITISRRDPWKNIFYEPIEWNFITNNSYFVHIAGKNKTKFKKMTLICKHNFILSNFHNFEIYVVDRNSFYSSNIHALSRIFNTINREGWKKYIQKIQFFFC